MGLALVEFLFYPPSVEGSDESRRGKNALQEREGAGRVSADEEAGILGDPQAIPGDKHRDSAGRGGDYHSLFSICPRRDLCRCYVTYTPVCNAEGLGPGGEHICHFQTVMRKCSRREVKKL